MVEIVLGDFTAGYTAAGIREIQEALIRMGYSPGVPDGFMGPNTRIGMNAFAQAVKVDLDRTADFESRFRDLILEYAQVHDEYGSGWQSIVAETDFDPWVALQPRGEAIMRREGPAGEIVRLLDEYLARNAAPSASAAVPGSGYVFEVSYRLNDGVLAELANRTDAVVSENAAGREYLSLPVFRTVLESVSPSLASDRTEADRIARVGLQGYPIADYADTENVRWSGGPLLDSCGCLNNFDDKVVYGFHPFWNQGDDLLELDFSNLSRVGYFAVPFDREGNITISETIDWDVSRAAFVNEARKYGTSVDVVVYNDQWERWRVPDPGFIDRLARQTYELLLPELTDGFLNYSRPFFSLGAAQIPTLGDGVTLYFDFEQLGRSLYEDVFLNVAAYVEQVRHLLTEAGGGRELNLLVSMETMSDLTRPVGQYTFYDIEGIVESVDHFLVLLTEPTPDTKKSLRDSIEVAFSGEERRTVLRKTIPVIHPTKADDDAEPFEDDLVYFEDNFGGVGFWPLPPREAEALNTRVESVFLSTQSRDFVESVQRRYLSSWCAVSCPNRWVGRIIFDSLFWLFVLSVGLWFAIAEVRVWWRKYYVVPILAGMVALAFVNLYVCDPWLNGIRDEILGAMLVLVLVTLGLWGLFVKPTQENYP